VAGLAKLADRAGTWQVVIDRLSLLWWESHPILFGTSRASGHSHAGRQLGFAAAGVALDALQGCEACSNGMIKGGRLGKLHACTRQRPAREVRAATSILSGGPDLPPWPYAGACAVGRIF